MKYLIFALTICGHFFAAKYLKLLDNFFIIAGIIVISLGLGAGLFFSFKNEKDSVGREIGWGILYGSLTSVIVVISLIIYLIIAL
jgi:hypothetical protein